MRQNLLTLLQQQNRYGWNIGHIIARHQTDPAVAKAFLRFLTSFSINNADAVLTLLQKQNQDGWNIGHFIARSQTDPAVTVAYLSLLMSFSINNANAVLTLLQQQIQSSVNIGHFIARYQTDPAVTVAYLSLLTSFSINNANAVLTLLQQQTQGGGNIGHFIAVYQTDPAVTAAYLDLLTRLVAGFPAQVFAVLAQKLSDSRDPELQRRIEKTGVNLGDIIEIKHPCLLNTYHKCYLEAFAKLITGADHPNVATFLDHCRAEILTVRELSPLSLTLNKKDIEHLMHSLTNAVKVPQDQLTTSLEQRLFDGEDAWLAMSIDDKMIWLIQNLQDLLTQLSSKRKHEEDNDDDEQQSSIARVDDYLDDGQHFNCLNAQPVLSLQESDTAQLDCVPPLSVGLNQAQKTHSPRDKFIGFSDLSGIHALGSVANNSGSVAKS